MYEIYSVYANKVFKKEDIQCDPLIEKLGDPCARATSTLLSMASGWGKECRKYWQFSTSRQLVNVAAQKLEHLCQPVGAPPSWLEQETSEMRWINLHWLSSPVWRAAAAKPAFPNLLCYLAGGMKGWLIRATAVPALQLCMPSGWGKSERSMGNTSGQYSTDR